MATICFTYRVFLLPFWKLFNIQCHLHKKSCSAHIITEAYLLSKHIKHQIVIYLTDGGWSNWTSLACSVTCGIGVQASFRKCNNPAPEFGGNPCDGDTHSFQYCNTPCAGKNYSVVLHRCCVLFVVVVVVVIVVVVVFVVVVVVGDVVVVDVVVVVVQSDLYVRIQAY